MSINFKAEIKLQSSLIKQASTAVFANRILLRDYSAGIAALKAAIRQANRDGNGKSVSVLTKELNIRRAVVNSAHQAQIDNRRILRNAYIVRKQLIADWVASEEA